LIRLFTTRFVEPREERRREYDEALRRNIENAVIDQVCILDESGVIKPESKIRVRTIGRRPTYADYFAWINEVSTAADVSVIANADIVIGDSFAVFRRWRLPSRTVLALARWDRLSDGRHAIRDRNDSQDSWVFQGTVTDVAGNFEIGRPRCDNRMAKEIEIAGYSLLNPSLSLHTFHLHGGNRGEYAHGLQDGFVPPPYGYVWPHNLWSLQRTLFWNSRNTDARVGWRFDRRAWSRRLGLHRVAKLIAAFPRGRDPSA
jgi:hypothetical protein